MRRFFLLLLFICTAVRVSAQDSLKDKFNSFRQSSVISFNGFRDAANARYAEFLLTSWKRFESQPTVKNPDDQNVPPVEYDGGEGQGSGSVEVPYIRFADKSGTDLRPQPATTIEEQQWNQQSFSFSCFGMDLTVRASEQNSYELSSLDTGDISEAWKKISGHEYNNMILDFLAIRRDHNLSDWAYLQVIRCFTEKFLGSGDAATLLSAFIFSQSGYRMRLGMDENRLYLLFGTDDIIYDKPYFEIDGCKYFALEGDISDMFIADIPGQDEKSLSMNIGRQLLGNEGETRRSFKSKRYGVTAECSVGEGQMSFFSSYPASQPGDDYLTRWARYACAPMDEGICSQLYPWLKFAILGKTGAESVDILLDFVQTAFTYKKDEDIWGADRIFFAEETLHYPFCDCEDRAILFVRLVRDLLGFDVALVYYPGHLAAAVRIPGGAEGDGFSLPGGDYIVCDPTYIGAPVGKTMPGMDNKSARLLLL